ncbi:MAG: hypothetical protein K5906_03375 [Bacilli bacterium]|nr:hypothetical protein [Bacilli bacterium]
MKAKKLILLVPMLLSLAACNGSKDSIAGTYSFQLGSNEGTHAAIHLMLSDDQYSDGNLDTPAKKFSLTFDIKGEDDGNDMFSTIGTIAELLGGDEDTSESSSETTSSSETSSTEATSSEATTSESPDVSVHGYYRMLELSLDDGSTVNYLSMGISILDEYEISPFIVEKIMYATYSDDAVTVVVPVSIKDLFYQLYWYGYRISSLSSLLNPVKLPEENPLLKYNTVGTKPTAEQAKDIAAYQKKRQADAKEGIITNYEEGEEIYNDYFVYHTLSMGLNKR